MPMPFHMYVVGNTQSNIEGSCDQEGREGSILCQAFDHEITIPRDPQTGLPVGKRLHKPLVVTKMYDKSSPKLEQALTSGEQVEVELKWYRIDPSGVEEHYYTIKLEEAIVVAIKGWTPNCLDALKEGFSHMEDVAYTYSKIIWTWEPDGIESEDSWKAPKA